jgi:hypothetical protein
MALNFLKKKPVTEDEKIILEIVENLLSKEDTFSALYEGVGYISNENKKHNVIIYSDCVSISNGEFRNIRIRSSFSDMIRIKILDVLKGKVKKIKEASKNVETSSLNNVLANLS